MFSRLDKIFRTLPRHTEHLETNLGLRNKTDEQGKKKKGTKKDEDDGLFSDDKPTVSINALVTLLESLLSQHTEQSGEPEDKTPGEDRRKSDKIAVKSDGHDSTPPVAISTTHAKALGAYQKGREISPSQPPIKDRRKQKTAPVMDVTLTNEEIKHIKQALSKLTEISTRGITELTIETNTSFLNGILAAIDKLES
jgi:hypothetical protein